MTRPTKPEVRDFDIANYIQTPADIAAYLTVAAEEAEGNPKELVAALRRVIHAHTELKDVADLSENDAPSLEAVINLMHTFGLRIRFEAAGA